MLLQGTCGRGKNFILECGGTVGSTSVDARVSVEAHSSAEEGTVGTGGAE